MALPGSGSPLGDHDSLDLAAAGTGVLAVLATFLPYWGVSAGDSSLSASWTAWHSYAVVGDLCLLAAAALAVAVLVRPAALSADLPVPPRVATAALAGFGTVLVVLRAVTMPDLPDGFGISLDIQWGAYVLFLAGAALAVTAGLGARRAGLARPGARPGTDATG